MKKHSNIFSTILPAVLLLSACAGEEVTSPEEERIEGPHVTLTVALPGTARTKGATQEGVDTWNENKVTSLYYFFYKEGSDTAAPKMSGHFAGLNLSGPGATKSWVIPTSADIISNQLFPSGTRECSAVIVANPTADVITYLDANESTITLKDLRERTFSSSLAGKQDSFVMVWDSLAVVGSRTGDESMSVTAHLRRLANKITVNANVAPEFFDKEGGWVRWEPQMNSLKVEFYNGMNKTNLGGDFSKLTIDSETDYFTSDPSKFGSATPIDRYLYQEISKLEAGTSYTALSALPAASSTSPEIVKVDTLYYKREQYQKASSTSPFYTYPMQWEYASATEPFLMIELIWARMSGSTTYQTCYYKLMLSQKSMTTNGWYDVTVDLDVMGSFNKFDPTQQYLHEDYAVLDWENAFVATDNNVNAEIKDARYLVIDQDHYELNNQKKLSIPFLSSHDCEIAGFTVKKTDFKTNAEVTVTPPTGSHWVTINGSVIEFDHDLDNNWASSTLDVSPYTFTITLQHVGDDTYSKTITITQYPAVYIETQINSGVRQDGPTSFTKLVDYGYTYVNTHQGEATAYNNVSNTFKISGTTIENPFMTIISVSQLDPDQNYIIGDPRIKSTTNTNGYPTWCVAAPESAPAQYDGASERRLKYYYETGGADYENFIAPKLRLVSGYSYNNGTRSYTNNQTRCAMYQEDGYPAGRWRLPTKAEMEFIKLMENKGLILGLFTGTTKYWSTTGTYGGTTWTAGTSGNACSRCVYDEWYWGPIDEAAGNKHSTKTFYWGDQPL